MPFTAWPARRGLPRCTPPVGDSGLTSGQLVAAIVVPVVAVVVIVGAILVWIVGRHRHRSLFLGTVRAPGVGPATTLLITGGRCGDACRRRWFACISVDLPRPRTARLLLTSCVDAADIESSSALWEALPEEVRNSFGGGAKGLRPGYSPGPSPALGTLVAAWLLVC